MKNNYDMDLPILVVLARNYKKLPKTKLNAISKKFIKKMKIPDAKILVNAILDYDNTLLDSRLKEKLKAIQKISIY